MSFLKPITVALIFLCAIQLYAQSNPNENDTCALAATLPNPPTDLPPGNADVPEHCDPWDMYYGEGQTMDLQGARYCAYVRLNTPDTAQNPVEAPAVLAMIYANGKSVAPNLQLAIKFACQIRGGWDDPSALVKMLDSKQKQGAIRVDFDVCDNPPGRQISYACLIRDQTRANNDVSAAEERLDSGSSESQHDAFENLLAARRGFLYAYEAEKPTGTVGIAQNDIFEDTEVENAWARVLSDLASGKFPQYTEEQFKKADADLNNEYRDARQHAASPDSVLQTEREWLTYREAFVSYAKLRWPWIPADTWRTLLTLERTKMLQGIE